jgi:hypothetical protein
VDGARHSSVNDIEALRQFSVLSALQSAVECSTDNIRSNNGAPTLENDTELAADASYLRVAPTDEALDPADGADASISNEPVRPLYQRENVHDPSAPIQFDPNEEAPQLQHIDADSLESQGALAAQRHQEQVLQSLAGNTRCRQHARMF